MGPRLSLAALAPPLFVALWATGFVGAKYALPYAEPMTTLALRFGLAAAALWLWAAAAGELRGRRFGGARTVGSAAVVGVLIHAVYLGGVFAAIWLGAGAALSALVVGLQPVATALLAGAMLGERLGPRRWAGMALGLAGVALVVWRKMDAGALEPFPLLLLVAALVAISYGTILQKRRAVTSRLAADGALQFAAAALVCAAAAGALETRRIDWTAEYVFALSWMVVVLSLGAISLFYAMLRRGEASKTASLFFLVPGVTAAMAWAMFGEAFGWAELAGLVLAAVGVRLAAQVEGSSTSGSASR
ncbi:MAG: DMT family transporter [Pseudomonadota bacterium]